MSVTVRPYRESDDDDVYRLRRLAFGGPRQPDADGHWPSGRTGWRGLVAEVAGGPVGFARSLHYGQYFGGVAVPMGGIASVAVDPHARGTGVAGAMLDAMVADLREAGHPISALYATVPQLYRRHGWEQVGVNERVTLPLGLFTTLPRPARPVTSRRARPADLDALGAAYRRFAATVDGMLDRVGGPFRAEQMLDFDVVDVVDGPDGFSGALLADRPEGETLTVLDLYAADVDTALHLLRRIAAWAGVLRDVTLRVTDPAIHATLLTPPTVHDVQNHPWMLRVVDLPAAVAARGWPHAEWLRPFAVDVEVVDAQAPWHAGNHRLVVDDGTVRCDPGGGGAVRLEARALGPWFAGSADAATLRRAGLLTGDPDAARLLDLLTGAPRMPRMTNAF